MSLQRPLRFSRSSGIAVGIVLFVLAIIAAVATAFSAAGNFTGSTINIDRIKNEVRGQANLIYTKINECYLNVKDVNHSGGSDYSTANYPASVGNGTLVENLDCPTYGASTQNIWTGQSQTPYPPAPDGLGPWYYVNAGDVGGRCIRIQPPAGLVNDPSIRQGLIEAAAGFSDFERSFDSSSSSQRLIFWITRPTGAASADCSS
jgi:hypothetical protein